MVSESALVSGTTGRAAAACSAAWRRTRAVPGSRRRFRSRRRGRPARRRSIRRRPRIPRTHPTGRRRRRECCAVQVLPMTLQLSRRSLQRKTSLASLQTSPRSTGGVQYPLIAGGDHLADVGRRAGARHQAAVRAGREEWRADPRRRLRVRHARRACGARPLLRHERTIAALGVGRRRGAGRFPGSIPAWRTPIRLHLSAAGTLPRQRSRRRRVAPCPKTLRHKCPAGARTAG